MAEAAPGGSSADAAPDAAPRPAAPAEASIRQLTVDDLPACADVFYAALDDLSERRHQAPWPRNEASMLRLYARLLASHPPGSAVAELDGRTVGFGIAVERERSWFLGFLFVEPGLQAGGIGRRLLERHPAGRGRGGLARRRRRPGDLRRGHPAGLDRAVRLARHATARPDLPARRHAAARRPAPPAAERRRACPFERLEASRRRASGWQRRWRPSTSPPSAIVGRSTTATIAPRGVAGILYPRPRGRTRDRLRLRPAERSPRAGLRDRPGAPGGRRVGPHRARAASPAPGSSWCPAPRPPWPRSCGPGLRFDEPPIVHCASAPCLAVEAYLLRSFALP